MNGKSPPTTSYQMLFPSQAVSFDADAFDQFIQTAGVQFVHFRSMRCPVGMVDLDDMRRPHDHHINCSNGFFFTQAGTVTCGFMGNSNDTRFMDAGQLDGSTVQIVMPRFYDDKPEVRVEFCNFDRVYLKEESVTVVNWDQFACSVEGVDKTQFPVVHVYDLMDAHGHSHHEGQDFDVRGGRIVWRDNKSPGIDPKSGKGVICTARYSYRPFWNVKRMIHEVRVGQVEDEFGERTLQRFPQAAVLQREYVYEKEQRDELAPNKDGRQQQLPADGTYGPR